jgi:hypothetical protein
LIGVKSLGGTVSLALPSGGYRVMMELENGFHGPRLLDEMFRNLSKDEQIRLLALIWIRRGTYSSREWRRAIADASVAYDLRTRAGLTLSRLP